MNRVVNIRFIRHLVSLVTVFIKKENRCDSLGVWLGFSFCFKPQLTDPLLLRPCRQLRKSSI